MLIVNHSEPNTNKEFLFVWLCVLLGNVAVRATFIAAILKVRKVTGMSLDASVIQWLALLDHSKKVVGSIPTRVLAVLWLELDTAGG